MYVTVKYSLMDMQADFPNEKACLMWLFEYRFPDGVHCPVCNKVTKHYYVASRKSFDCGGCGRHISPRAGTIFEGSSTPLTKWFYVIYVMSQTRAGISAAQMQRELGVTYKCAWRMMHQVRHLMGNTQSMLTGEVEVDETFIHPNVYKRSTAQKRYGRTGSRTGQVLFGMVERGGAVKIYHVKSAGVRVLTPIINANVRKGSLIHSDSYHAYDRLPVWGYDHRKTNHSKLEFYTEASHTQNIENVWSHLKRGMKGVYRHVEPHHLQAYADEYAFRYSHRHHWSIFWALMEQVSLRPPSSEAS